MPALNFLPLPRVSHPKPPAQTDGHPTLPGPWGRGTVDAAEKAAQASERSAQAAERSADAAKESVGVNRDSAIALAQRAEADALSERYQDAAAQLGHQSAAVRLAGGYAMARLADDWAEQRQTCVDVLCAYLRTPWPSQSAGNAAEDQSDQMVRNSLLTIISNHLRSEKSLPKWSDLEFDFSGASFRNFRLYNVTFRSTPNFSDATFEGRGHFERCRFLNGATFDRSEISGHVRFDQVQVSTNQMGTRLGFSPKSFSGAVICELGTLELWPHVLTENAKVLGFGTSIAGRLVINRRPMQVPCGNFLFEGIHLNSTARVDIDSALVAYAHSEPIDYELPEIIFLEWTVEPGAQFTLERNPVEVPLKSWIVPDPE